MYVVFYYKHFVLNLEAAQAVMYKFPSHHISQDNARRTSPNFICKCLKTWNGLDAVFKKLSTGKGNIVIYYLPWIKSKGVSHSLAIFNLLPPVQSGHAVHRRKEVTLFRGPESIKCYIYPPVPVCRSPDKVLFQVIFKIVCWNCDREAMLDQSVDFSLHVGTVLI